MDRLKDYATILLVVMVLYLLFRISRGLLNRLLGLLESRAGRLTSDHVLLYGFYCLIAGMSLLPLVTWGLAFLDNRRLTGGIVLHLVLVSISVILFSFAEDLFGSFRKYPSARWPWSIHFRRIAPVLLLFWAAGTALLSPLFYGGLSLVLAIFYAYALSIRT